MSREQPKVSQERPSFGDERDTIIAKAIAAGIPWSVEKQLGRTYLAVDLPNGGRAKRRVEIGRQGADLYSTIDFTVITALGPYEAVWQRSTGLIEAQVEGDRGLSIMRLGDMPEARQIIPKQDSLFEFEEEEDGVTPESTSEVFPRGWILRVQSDDSSMEIEISPPGLAILALGGRLVAANSGPRPRYGRPTLKIKGLNPSGYDDALSKLENLSSAFFFELDMKRNVVLKLSRARSRDYWSGGRFRKSEAALTVPKKKYSNDAISLYTYGRLALGMPLLQFLAYYQCVEYFFTQYWNSEIISRVRRIVNDPRFDSDQDAHVGRLVRAASAKGRDGASEREQLRTTIEACVEDADILEFLDENEQLKAALVAKNRIAGVAPLALMDRGNALTAQVARRIYDIRCRIVHAKEDGGASGNAEVLLPFSAEADLLAADVSLVRFVAQKAIIAGRRGAQ